MTDIYNINNRVAKISKEHKLINDYVAKFTEKLKNKDKEFFKELETFMSFLEKDLLQHFSFEETILFPAAIHGAQAYDITLLVMNLQKDHGVFETLLQLLINDLNILKSAKENPDQTLLKKIHKFLNALKLHTKREITDLFPLIDANSRSMAMMKLYAREIEKK